MADYKSKFTGSQIDNNLTKVEELEIKTLALDKKVIDLGIFNNFNKSHADNRLDFVRAVEAKVRELGSERSNRFYTGNILGNAPVFAQHDCDNTQTYVYETCDGEEGTFFNRFLYESGQLYEDFSTYSQSQIDNLLSDKVTTTNLDQLELDLKHEIRTLELTDSFYEGNLIKFKEDLIAREKLPNGCYTSFNTIESAFTRNTNVLYEFVKSNVYLTEGNHKILYLDNTVLAEFYISAEDVGYYDIYFQPGGNPDWGSNLYYLAKKEEVSTYSLRRTVPTTDKVCLRGEVKALTSEGLSWNSNTYFYEGTAENSIVTYIFFGVKMDAVGTTDQFKVYNPNTQRWYGYNYLTEEGRRLANPTGDDGIDKNIGIRNYGLYDICFKEYYDESGNVTKEEIELTLSTFSSYFLDEISYSFKAITNLNQAVILDAVNGVTRITYDHGGNLIEDRLISEREVDRKIEQLKDFIAQTYRTK